MTTEEARGLLRDAAKVHAKTVEVQEAVAALAVRPLDEKAAVRMRQVLDGDLAAAQASLKRLHVVPNQDEDED